MGIKKGDIFTSNNHGDVEVINYVNSGEVYIKFSCGKVKAVSGGNLIKGEVSPKTVDYKGKPISELLERNGAYSNYTIIGDPTYKISFICSKCNETYGLDNYVFECRRSSLQEGKISCLCSTRKNLKDDYLKRKYYNKVLKGRGEYSDYVYVRGRPKVEWYCTQGHRVLSNRSDLIHHNSGCAICKSSNYYNIIYIALLSDGSNILTKLGVTNNMCSRLKAYEKDGLTVIKHQFINTSGFYTPNALHLEQELLFYIRLYGLDDKETFKGFVGFTEMMDESYYDILEDVLLNINIKGDIWEEDLRSLLIV